MKSLIKGKKVLTVPNDWIKPIQEDNGGGVSWFACPICGSTLTHPTFMTKSNQKPKENWEESYWELWTETDLTNLDGLIFEFIKDLLKEAESRGYDQGKEEIAKAYLKSDTKMITEVQSQARKELLGEIRKGLTELKTMQHGLASESPTPYWIKKDDLLAYLNRLEKEL